MRRLDVRLSTPGGSRPVGHLAAESGGPLLFEYAPEFLAAPLPLSPIKLPAAPGLYRHDNRDFGPVFGLFNDSLPDGWGLLLMDREFRKRRIDPLSLTALDRLAYIGVHAMGALTYHPPEPDADGARDPLDLQEIARQTQRIVMGSTEDVLPQLRLAGGSPGGARPKVLVGVREDGRMISGAGEIPADHRPFIIKFGAREDPAEIGDVELAYWHMARASGVDVPDARLFSTPDGGRYFGVERFDRRNGSRVHMHTLGGLLHASHRVPSLEYEGFLRATRLLTRDQRQVDEAFRRMAFNVFAHNRDDHVKNFSYLMNERGEWTLSPAYDLVYSHGPGGEHTMALSGEARNPGGDDLLRVADVTGVDRARARRMIAEVRDAVHRWPEFASRVDLSREATSAIHTALSRIR